MNEITGNEPAMPSSVACAEGDNNLYNGASAISGGNGLTIRQLALKDFMCRLMNGYPAHPQNGTDAIENDAKNISEVADIFVTAYISQLNKHSGI